MSSSVQEIRSFEPGDVPHLIEILRCNGQYGHPEVEGPEAMPRFAGHQGAVFLVAERPPVGLVRGIYDGSRAVIHLLSVHPARQCKGLGRSLVEACVAQLHALGAPSVSATATTASLGFWEKLGFAPLDVRLCLRKLHSD
jgi:GNAT superfamily N-acetyltransferase